MLSASSKGPLAMPGVRPSSIGCKTNLRWTTCYASSPGTIVGTSNNADYSNHVKPVGPEHDLHSKDTLQQQLIVAPVEPQATLDSGKSAEYIGTNITGELSQSQTIVTQVEPSTREANTRSSINTPQSTFKPSEQRSQIRKASLVLLVPMIICGMHITAVILDFFMSTSLYSVIGLHRVVELIAGSDVDIGIQDGASDAATGTPSELMPDNGDEIPGDDGLGSPVGDLDQQASKLPEDVNAASRNPPLEGVSSWLVIGLVKAQSWLLDVWNVCFEGQNILDAFFSWWESSPAAEVVRTIMNLGIPLYAVWASCHHLPIVRAMYIVAGLTLTRFQNAVLGLEERVPANGNSAPQSEQSTSQQAQTAVHHANNIGSKVSTGSTTTQAGGAQLISHTEALAESDAIKLQEADRRQEKVEGDASTNVSTSQQDVSQRHVQPSHDDASHESQLSTHDTRYAPSNGKADSPAAARHPSTADDIETSSAPTAVSPSSAPSAQINQQSPSHDARNANDTNTEQSSRQLDESQPHSSSPMMEDSSMNQAETGPSSSPSSDSDERRGLVLCKGATAVLKVGLSLCAVTCSIVPYTSIGSGAVDQLFGFAGVCIAWVVLIASSTYFMKAWSSSAVTFFDSSHDELMKQMGWLLVIMSCLSGAAAYNSLDSDVNTILEVVSASHDSGADLDISATPGAEEMQAAVHVAAQKAAAAGTSLDALMNALTRATQYARFAVTFLALVTGVTQAMLIRVPMIHLKPLLSVACLCSLTMSRLYLLALI